MPVTNQRLVERVRGSLFPGEPIIGECLDLLAERLAAAEEFLQFTAQEQSHPRGPHDAEVGIRARAILKEWAS